MNTTKIKHFDLNKVSFDEVKTNVFTFRYVITPEMAGNILSETVFRNRTIRRATVNCYVNDMKEGRWRFNGETIKFDINGNLFDGQHRLEAVKLSGVSVEFLIAYGLPVETAATIDIGNKRSLENYLQLAGYGYVKGVGSVIRMHKQLERGNNATGQSNAQIGQTPEPLVEEYKKNETLYNRATEYARDINKINKTLKKPEVGGFYVFLVFNRGENEDAVKDFFDKLARITMGATSIYNKTCKELDKKCGAERILEYKKCWESHKKGNKCRR